MNRTRGTVVTFYSYKGGVGRTFALANTAVLLSSWGYRTLCVDWDLDAPGLPFYLRDGPRWRSPSRGLVDLVDDFTVGLKPYYLRDYIRETGLAAAAGGGALDLLAAGGSGSAYVEKAQALDWERLYRKNDLGAFLEDCRERWVDEYDFVLIDSRTGITDVGGICTAQLPDILVLLFTANDQSLRGVIDVVGRAERARDDLPYDRSRLLKLPIPSRFDAREEYERAQRWRATFVRELEPLVREWRPDGVPFEKLLGHLTIPYVSYWSFGEDLPASREPDPSPDQIGYPLQTLAALIARKLERGDLLAESRDAYVEAVAGARQAYRYDAYISCAEGDGASADRLTAQLAGRLAVPDRQVPWGPALVDVSHECRHLVVLVGPRFSAEQEREVNRFVRQALSSGRERRVFPVLLPGGDIRALPPVLRDIQSLRADGDGNLTQAADRLAAEMRD